MACTCVVASSCLHKLSIWIGSPATCCGLSGDDVASDAGRLNKAHTRRRRLMSQQRQTENDHINERYPPRTRRLGHSSLRATVQIKRVSGPSKKKESKKRVSDHGILHHNCSLRLTGETTSRWTRLANATACFVTFLWFCLPLL